MAGLRSAACLASAGECAVVVHSLSSSILLVFKFTSHLGVSPPLDRSFSQLYIKCALASGFGVTGPALLPTCLLRRLPSPFLASITEFA